MSLMKEVQYDSAFMFIYSPRPGTGAPNLPDPTPLEEKHERLQRLIEMQNEMSAKLNQKLVGTTREVLVEAVSERDASQLTARTRGDKIVTFTGSSDLVGKLVPVKITHARTWTLLGEQ